MSSSTIIRHDDMRGCFELIVVSNYTHNSAKLLNVFGFVNEGAFTTINHNDWPVLVQTRFFQMLMVEVRFFELLASILITQRIVDSATYLSAVCEITKITKGRSQ